MGKAFGCIGVALLCILCFVVGLSLAVSGITLLSSYVRSGDHKEESVKEAKKEGSKDATKR